MTEHGQFGMDTQVALVNDGSCTIILDSQELYIIKGCFQLHQGKERTAPSALLY